MMDGGYGYKNIGDRAGIHCRTVADAVKVLDAAKGFDTRDIYSALPMNTIPKQPYTSFLVSDEQVASKPLKGIRIAIAREFMVKHTRNDAAISDQTGQGDQSRPCATSSAPSSSRRPIRSMRTTLPCPT